MVFIFGLMARYLIIIQKYKMGQYFWTDDRRYKGYCANGK